MAEKKLCRCGCGRWTTAECGIRHECRKKFLKDPEKYFTPVSIKYCIWCGEIFFQYKELPWTVKKEVCDQSCGRQLDAAKKKAAGIITPRGEFDDSDLLEGIGPRVKLSSIPHPTKYEFAYCEGPVNHCENRL